MKKEFWDLNVLQNMYEIELGEEDNFFEDSEDLYVYYYIRSTQTGECVSEGIEIFDASFMDGLLETLPEKEQREVIHSYLEGHVSDLLHKRNVHTLNPYVKDLVLASVTSDSGMYFVECYEEMTNEERALYTAETLEIIRNEVDKEGLSDYIEVGYLETYEKKEGALSPSFEPVITVYMGAGTLFDLSEPDTKVRNQKKVPLKEQIETAKLEQKESTPKDKKAHERA